MSNIDITAEFAAIAARYTAARAVLRDSKKVNGKKAPETSAARKVVRTIKLERAAFVKAHPECAAEPKAPKTAAPAPAPAPVVDHSAGETVAIFKGGQFMQPDGVTPHPTLNNAAAPPAAEHIVAELNLAVPPPAPAPIFNAVPAGAPRKKPATKKAPAATAPKKAVKK